MNQIATHAWTRRVVRNRRRHLGRMTRQRRRCPQLTQQASQLTPEQVQEIATRAEHHGVLDKVGGFAEHPQLVKTLGSAALAVH